MSLEAYISNVQSKTGKTLQDFRDLARKKGLLTADARAMPLIDWLKHEFALGHGHAMAVIEAFKRKGWFPAKVDKNPSSKSRSASSIARARK